MEKKKLITDFRSALKNKAIDTKNFKEFCEALNSDATTQAELATIFNKTTISYLVALQDAEIFCAMSSYFWHASIDLWELFMEVARDRKKIHTHQFYNELIKYGDSRVMLMVEDFLNSGSVKISGKFEKFGSADRDSEITPEFARKIANYTGEVYLETNEISVESAKILSYKKGPIDISILFHKEFYKGKTPNWENYGGFFRNVVDQSRGSFITFHAAGINRDLAAILGGASCLLELPEIKHLTVGMAKGLAKHRGDAYGEDLAIGGGDTLKCDPGALEQFEKHEGRLDLRGVINEITLDDAKALGCHKGRLHINLRNMPDAQALKELLKVKPDLILTITKHQTQSYQPPLTPELAEIISNYEGEYLSFDYFGEIPLQCAEKLAKLRKRLFIGGNLDDEAKDRLEGAGVSLRCISTETLTAKVLDLPKVERFLEDKESVNLAEMTSITEDAVVTALSNYEGDLDLSGITQLSDSAVKDLSKHQVGYLLLNGLTALSDSAVKDLSTHQGHLSLNGLTELSAAAAEALSKHQGKLSLNGLTELSDAAAKALSKHQGLLILDGLADLSDVAAEAFSNYQGGLCFDGLTELSDAAAEALAKHPGNLYLGRLTELSDAAAVALAKLDGDLSLLGLIKLPDATAEALSKHKGALFLHYVKVLSKAAATALLKHQGQIDSTDPAKWVDWKNEYWA